jgi:peptidoglycan/LPS O-acetylase OafA/YrhL
LGGREPTEPIDLALRFAVAALGGLAVGVEREWSSRAAGRPRCAGVRTFFMLGLIGGLAAELDASGQTAAAAVALLAACGLTVVAYAAMALQGHVDRTTGVAALLVLAASVLVFSGLTFTGFLALRIAGNSGERCLSGSRAAGSR